MQRSVSLTLVITACLWFAVRDLVPISVGPVSVGTISVGPVSIGPDDVLDNALAIDIRGIDSAIESLSRTIERQLAEGATPEHLAQSYRLRGSYRLQKHETHEACADFDEALCLYPGEVAARYGRAECFRQLGDPDRANAEMLQVAPLDLGDAFPQLKRFAVWSGGLMAFFAAPAGAWLVVIVAWILLTFTNIAVGRAQTAEAAGSVVRLLWVATALGLLEALPLAVWATLAACHVTAEGLGWLAGGLTVLCLIGTLTILQPPVRMRAKGMTLPRVKDGEFLKRVAELANQMHVPVPVVRLWASTSGTQQALAFAGTIQAPQLVVTDGILTRLAPLERDAIVAHELGHIANGSLWLATSVVPVSCALATAVSAWFGLSIAVPFGLALGMGLRRIVSRPLEFDADRRAALAIGFRETTAALTKIHAVHPLGTSGLLPLLVYATATHPSLEMRLWSLNAADSKGGHFPFEPCPGTIRRHQLAARAAFALWLLVLVGTLVAAAWVPQISFPATALWIVTFIPTALVTMAQRRQVSLANRRLGRRPVRTALAVMALLALPVLGYFPDETSWLLSSLGWFNDSEYFLFFPLLLAGVGLIGASSLKRVQETQKLRGAIVVAYQMHDFPRVLEIGRSAPAVVARDPFLRYHIAFARAISGDCPAAIAELQRLWQDRPDFALTAFTLTSLLLDADLAEQALVVAQDLARRLPDDADAHVLAARALRRLGRREESRGACERALQIDPRNGKARAVAAANEVDAGEYIEAGRSIAQALELSPGEPYALLVQAEIALRTQPFNNPRAAVEEARATIRANPLAFFHADVMRLERALADWEWQDSRL